jgi:hypothetical protein
MPYHEPDPEGPDPDDEPKEGSNTGNAGKGRPKGALNKTTRAAKEAIAFAAEGLGGAERLMAWALKDPRNESAFWTSIYPKLLPLQVAGDPDSPLTVINRIERVLIKAEPK